MTSALLDRPEGFPEGRSRLSPEIDTLISTEIEQFFLTRPKPTLAQLVRRIGHGDRI